VENSITIMKKAQETLATIEDKEFKSVKEAEDAGARYCKYAVNWINKKLARDADHTGTDPESPKPRRGYPPIGKMPQDP